MAMMLAAVLLWGYAIGTFIQLQGDSGELSAAEINDAYHRYENPLTTIDAEDEPLKTRQDLVDFSQSHRRFKARDNSFMQRLEYDKEFRLKNSF